ncbi:MAG: sterol desaturase family protein [Bdellovibrionales bacterium]
MDNLAVIRAGRWCVGNWLVLAVAAFCLFALAETLFPIRLLRNSNVLSKWTTNIMSHVSGLILLGWLGPFAVGHFITPYVTSATLPMARLEQWGGPLPVLILGLLTMDLYFYLIHRLSHSSPLLWRWHRFHHDEAELDVSVGLRHHPAEAIVNGTLFLILFSLLGAPWWLFQLHAILDVPLSGFHHVNTRLLPVRVERTIGLLFVAPKDHHVHHSLSDKHFGKNFGRLFSVWDRLFGTFCSVSKQEHAQLKFGVDESICSDPNRHP